MREFVYLSDRKLRQFVPEPTSWWRMIGKLKGQVGIPHMASLTLELPAAITDEAARIRHLQRVVAKIEEYAQWYESEELVPGEWIFFENRFIYGSFGEGGKGVVLFLNPGDPDRGSDQTRLLMHGSPQHLLGNVWFHDELRKEWWSTSEGYMFYDLVGEVLDLDEALRAGLPRSKKRRTEPSPRVRISSIEVAVALQDKVDLNTAEWMSGCARVTAIESHWIGGRLVVATPLYVERCPPSRGP
jgi:hypothetical protein